MFELPYLTMMKLHDGDDGCHRRSPSHSVDVRVSGPTCFPTPGGPASAASQQRVVARVAVRLRLSRRAADSKTGRHPAKRRYLPATTTTVLPFQWYFSHAQSYYFMEATEFWLSRKLDEAHIQEKCLVTKAYDRYCVILLGIKPFSFLIFRLTLQINGWNTQTNTRLWTVKSSVSQGKSKNLTLNFYEYDDNSCYQRDFLLLCHLSLPILKPSAFLSSITIPSTPPPQTRSYHELIGQ